MSDLYYSTEDFEKIISTFSDKGIKLEFDNPTALFSAIRKISTYCFQKQTEELFKKSTAFTWFEFDILNRKIDGIKESYSNSTIIISNYPQIFSHISLIGELFLFYPGSSVNYFGHYSILKCPENKKAKKFYYSLDNRILYDVSVESWDHIFKEFNLDLYHVDFLKKNSEHVSLSYIVFDLNDEISELIFYLPSSKFFDNQPELQYFQYVNLKEIIQILKEESIDFDLEITYNLKNKESIIFDVFLSNDNIKRVYEVLKSCEIINDIEYNNFISMNIPENSMEYCLKFEWQNKDKFSVKYCLETTGQFGN